MNNSAYFVTEHCNVLCSAAIVYSIAMYNATFNYFYFSSVLVLSHSPHCWPGIWQFSYPEQSVFVTDLQLQVYI
jgi:hypothetical protein